MRSKKELLILLRKYIADYIPGYVNGLCAVINYLLTFRVITSDEKYVLFTMIYDNKPKPQYDMLYWWKPGELEPRLAFIDKLISQCDESV